MPQSPDTPDFLSCLEKSVRQGDWNLVAVLTDRIGGDRLPATPDECGERLRRLQNVLVAARIARANLAISLTRVRAAAGFTHARALHARQGFGAAADS